MGMLYQITERLILDFTQEIRDPFRHLHSQKLNLLE